MLEARDIPGDTQDAAPLLWAVITSGLDVYHNPLLPAAIDARADTSEQLQVPSSSKHTQSHRQLSAFSCRHIGSSVPVPELQEAVEKSLNIDLYFLPAH